MEGVSCGASSTASINGAFCGGCCDVGVEKVTTTSGRMLVVEDCDAVASLSAIACCNTSACCIARVVIRGCGDCAVCCCGFDALRKCVPRPDLLGELFGVDCADDTLSVDVAGNGSVEREEACNGMRDDGSLLLTDETGRAADGSGSKFDSCVGCTLQLNAGVAAVSGAAVSVACTTEGAATKDVVVPKLEFVACCAGFVDGGVSLTVRSIDEIDGAVLSGTW